MSRAGSSSSQRGRPQPPSRPSKGKNKAEAIDLTTSPIPVPSDSDDDEDEDDFEEVEVPSVPLGSTSGPATPATGADDVSVDYDESADLEDDAGEVDDEPNQPQVIRIELGGETEEEKARKIALAMRKKPMTAKDRALRLEAHKIHVICLLASTRVRNIWASDALLQCRLLSLLPHSYAAAFNIPPKRFPDKAQRSRLFLEALQSLVNWWSQEFFDISDPYLGLRTRTWDEVEPVVERLPRLSKAEFFGGPLSGKAKKDKKGKGKAKEVEDPVVALLEDALGGERLRSVNSMAKKALQQEGSRDVSAQLFVALARAVGLGVRLVVSVQAVPWRAEKPSAKKKTGGGSHARDFAHRQGLGTDYSGSEGDDLEEVPIPGQTPSPAGTPRSKVRAAGKRRLKDPADLYRLRKQRPAPQTVGSKPKAKKKEDMMAQPPVFWAEVYNRSDQRWVPVDPVNGIIRKRGPYEPSTDSGPVRMTYVVGFEEDGYARDVTRRYTKHFSSKVSKLRPPQPKDGGPDWWSEVTEFLQRPIRLNRDDLEDAELELSQASEGMPLHMSGFKDHPVYALERHLRQNEVIRPKREVGRFKGEAVYRRAHVLECRTAENWMRVGRRVRERQEPMKWIKQRAVTIQKRRAQELAMQESGEPIMQGLYSEDQTELYIPPPIQDGKIPQNAFGNIDLYVPTMLPAGAAHLPYKGIAKVAKQLKVSYAEAVTSFEFRKQRAIPVITGIVVAKEKEDEVMEAYWKSHAAAEEREKARREERALKRWSRLINGLRVRLRLRAEYGESDELGEQQHNPMSMAAESRSGQRTAGSIIALANQKASSAWVDGVRDQASEEPPEEKPDAEAGAEEVPADTIPEVAPAPAPSASPAPAAPSTPKIKLRINSAAATPVPSEPEQPATTRSGRPKRAVANGAKTTKKATKPSPKKRATRGRKRKANSDDESEAEESEEERPKRNGRRAASPPAPTRVLRSRAAKARPSLREAGSSDEEDM